MVSDRMRRSMYPDYSCILCFGCCTYLILFTNILFGIFDILLASGVWNSKSNTSRTDFLEICHDNKINLYYYLLGSLSISQTLLFVFGCGNKIIYSIGFCCSIPLYGIMIWGMIIVDNIKKYNCEIDGYRLYRPLIVFIVWSIIIGVIIIFWICYFICFIIDVYLDEQKNNNPKNIILEHNKQKNNIQMNDYTNIILEHNEQNNNIQEDNNTNIIPLHDKNIIPMYDENNIKLLSVEFC